MGTKFYSPFDKNLALFPAMSKVSPVYTIPNYFCKMHCNVIVPSTLDIDETITF